jgi:hypothetical protein
MPDIQDSDAEWAPLEVTEEERQEIAATATAIEKLLVRRGASIKICCHALVSLAVANLVENCGDDDAHIIEELKKLLFEARTQGLTKQ